MRKIRQVTAVPGGGEANGFLLFALCEDGTLWFRESLYFGVWEEVVPVPGAVTPDGVK